MLRLAIIFSFLVSMTFQISAQENNLDFMKTNALNQAVRMGNAFVAKNYETALDLTHPEFVKMQGGKKQVKSRLIKGYGGGAELVEIKIRKPNRIISTPKSFQCTLSQLKKIKFAGGELITTSTLVGLSYDSGETWVFVDASNNTIENLRMLLPELSDKHHIIAEGEPELIQY